MTFNAKNLIYGIDTDSTQPAFLRRLRSEIGDGDSARHKRPLARPRKHIISDDDDDDEPTYVDGNNQNAISKADYDALMNPKKLEKEEERSASSSPITQNRQIEEHASVGEAHLNHEAPPSQLEASIGGNSKKRLAKIVGDVSESVPSSPKGNPSTIDSGSISGFKKKEKKAKKIKLSFDEDDRK
ncbi:hypothetical protein MMC07_002133 [Pseudocyphellaria aurata]|nr:hypothetical protein [Pseudocyphellaria aurata]